MAKTIYVLNGPNLNLLGTREPEKYGRATLADVEKLCRDDRQALRPRHRVPPVQHRRRAGRLDPGGAAPRSAAGIVINPAGYTTTSIAILDALLAVEAAGDRGATSPISTRAKAFRHNSYVSKAAKAVIAGFGVEGYALAITGLAGMIGAKAKELTKHCAWQRRRKHRWSTAS